MIKIIGIILFLLFVGSGALLLVNQLSNPRKDKSQIELESSPTLTPLPATSTPPPPTKQIPSPTGKPDWQTYTNLKLGFSIKHPKNLTPEEMDDKSVVFQLWGPKQANDTEFYDGVNISFEKRPTGEKKLSEIVEENQKGSKEIWGDREVGKITTATLGGLSGFTYNASGHVYYYLNLDGWNYLEILNLSGDPGNLGYVTTSKNMLLTFQKI